MDLTIPGICFLTSSVPLEFNTDGHITRLAPMGSHNIHPGRVLVLTQLHIHLLRIRSVPEISIFDSISIPDHLNAPAIYDANHDLNDKNILILMLNGWGDMILIQPALRSFYKTIASMSTPPRITLGCDWIHNFPYPNAPYIHHIRSNILTLTDLCSFDVFVNFIPVNYQRSRERSMRDLCLDILKLGPETGGNDPPSIKPNHERVSKIEPALDQIRKTTGKKLLCVNWKSRFHHKDASPQLFFQIATRLSNTYQSLLFKDEEGSKIMQEEIDAFHMPIINLSSVINDYHDTVAALSLVDAFISVDTGIVHAAGAMGIPGVALFGPFPPETHVSDYTSIAPIRAPFKGKLCQGPCLETHKGCAEVDYSSETVSPCFQAIDVDQVIKALEDIISVQNNSALLTA